MTTIGFTEGRQRFATIRIWALATRPRFLLLSVVLIFLGTCIAWYGGYFQIGYAVLAFVGLLLAHISVNVLNDYFDYKSGIDLETKRTPFSGGSGILPDGLLKPRQAFWFGMISFLLFISIGVYFISIRGWLILPLMLGAAFLVFLYSPRILRLRWPEWAPALGMGTLPVLGAYFVQTGTFLPAIVASIPSGILVHNLLLLNEFPDVEADKTGGRKTLPIILGKRRASIVYSVLTLVVYSWIIGAVVTGQMPTFCLIALGTLPFALKAIQGVLKSQELDNVVPAMGNNVLVVLLTQVLLGIGYILTKVFLS